MAKGYKPGDVFEVGTKRGLRFVQLTHRHRMFGELVRAVAPANEHPTNIAAAVNQPTAFKVFTPLSVAVRAGRFAYVGNLPVPPEDQIFPLFKDSMSDPATKRVETWWLWDGEKEWRVGKLTSAQMRYPIRAIVGCDNIIDRLEEGYRDACQSS